jgi:hypothetical protein
MIEGPIQKLNLEVLVPATHVAAPVQPREHPVPFQNAILLILVVPILIGPNQHSPIRNHAVLPHVLTLPVLHVPLSVPIVVVNLLFMIK